MVNKAIKTILSFICVLLICFPCATLLADTTPELAIVKVNDILIYITPANQLISEAKERNVPVSEKISPDGHIDYIIGDSKLSTELLSLYNKAISKSQLSKDDVIIEYNTKDNDSIIELIQVNKVRYLITGVRFLRKQK
jgi:hypothetical protein